MSRRRPSAGLWLLVLLGISLVQPAPAAAQTDPTAQCGQGVQFYRQGRTAEALPLLEAGFAGRANANFASPDDMTYCALALGRLRKNRGDTAGALAAYAVARESSQLSGDASLEAMVLNNIGVVYHLQERYDEALDVYQQALAIAQEAGNREGEGAALSNMVSVYESQSRLAEALETRQQVLTYAREVGNQALEGAALNGIGVIYHGQGHYREALEAFQKALVIVQEMGDRKNASTTLNNIGRIYEDQGRYAEALDAYQEVLATTRELSDRTGEGGALNGVGGVYDKQGRYGEAMDAFQQALVIMRETGDRAGEGATLNNIGGVYWGQGRHDEALETYLRALDIVREVDDRAGEGVTLNNIGLVYQSQGRLGEALGIYQETLSIRREVGDRAGEAVTLNGIGGVHDSEGRYAEALNAYHQALAIAREMGDRVGEGTTLNNIGTVFRGLGRHAEALDSYQQALAIRREVGSGDGEGTTLYNIGYLYDQQGQTDEALSYYEQAMAAVDMLRAVAGSEAGRAAFIAQYAGLYYSAVRLYHEQRRDEQAFQTSERGRARTFLDAVSSGEVELSDNQAAELLTREQETYARWQDLQYALARARGTAPLDPALVADLESQLTAAKNAYTAVLDAFQERGDQLSALVPGRSSVLSLAEVQALLDVDTTLVAYQLLGDAGSLAFVIRADDMQVVELPEATPQNLQSAVTDLYLWRSMQNPHPAPLRDLHRWLVTPLDEHMIGRSVIIIPHQHLHYVPFAALSDGESYLGERFELAILPSASSLRFIQQNAAAPDSSIPALVFGNPMSDVARLASLRYAAQEAEETARLLGVSAYLGSKASEAQLRLGSTGAKVVHLSAHGGYNATNPLYSTIYLAPGDGQDGRLETHEVYGLDLKGNEVVVLSACETNVGELSAGDEVVGLTRAFFFAGAPTVISSLWCVDDAATGALMTAFYRHWLQDGMSKAQALQAAQADVRADSRWASPFYWAAFVLNGDPGVAKRDQQAQLPSRAEQAQQHALLYGAIALVLLLAGLGIVILLIRRRRHARE